MEMPESPKKHWTMESDEEEESTGAGKTRPAKVPSKIVPAGKTRPANVPSSLTPKYFLSPFKRPAALLSDDSESGIEGEDYPMLKNRLWRSLEDLEERWQEWPGFRRFSWQELRLDPFQSFRWTQELAKPILDVNPLRSFRRRQELAKPEYPIFDVNLFQSFRRRQELGKFQPSKRAGRYQRACLSKDQHASLYKRRLSGKDVCIKSYDGEYNSRYEREQLFLAEVRALALLRHRNIVKGIGWCKDENELLIVLEYYRDGSVLQARMDTPLLDPIPWDARFKICLDLASALLYMHEQCDCCVLHGSISSRSVWVDSNLNPKLTDFRWAVLLDHNSEAIDTSQIKRPGDPDYGFLDPEYLETHVYSKASDVYSFGLVALEMATGRRVGYDLLENLQTAPSSETIMQWADSKLEGKFDRSQMGRLITIGIRCTLPVGKQRPPIVEVMHHLKYGIPPPNVPSVDDGESSNPKDTKDYINYFSMDIPSQHKHDPSTPINLNDSQLQIMSGFLATLYESIETGAEIGELMDHITEFRSVMAMLDAPSDAWTSLVEPLLYELQVIGNLRAKGEDIGFPKARRTLSSLKANLAERIATIEKDIDKLEELMEKSKSALFEPQQGSSSIDFHNAQEHSMNLQERIMDAQRVEEVEVVDGRTAERLERIERIELGILTLHGSLVSRIPSFSFDR